VTVAFTLVALLLVVLIGMVCWSVVKQRKREQTQAKQRPPAQPVLGWMSGDWPMSWWCKRKGHRTGEWRSTYQPHVMIRYCSRCGAFECRQRPVGPLDPKRLP
jgi:hypothetical protein